MGDGNNGYETEPITNENIKYPDIIFELNKEAAELNRSALNRLQAQNTTGYTTKQIANEYIELSKKYRQLAAQFPKYSKDLNILATKYEKTADTHYKNAKAIKKWANPLNNSNSNGNMKGGRRKRQATRKRTNKRKQSRRKNNRRR